MKFMEATDEEVADETIEKARIITEQDAETLAEAFARLVGNECQIRGHFRFPIFLHNCGWLFNGAAHIHCKNNEFCCTVCSFIF